MKKIGLIVALVTATMFVLPLQAVVLFEDDFSTYTDNSSFYTPPSPWSKGGNANYDGFLSDGGDQYLNKVVGSSTEQKSDAVASIGANLNDYQDISLSLDCTHFTNSADGQELYVTIFDGADSNLWGSDNALYFYIKPSWMALRQKSNSNGSSWGGSDLVSGNITMGSDFSTLNITLTDTEWTLGVDAAMNAYGVSGGTVEGNMRVWSGTHTLDMTAFTDPKVSLQLRNVAGGSFSAGLDNLSITATAVPEPSTLASILIALGVMGLRRIVK